MVHTDDEAIIEVEFELQKIFPFIRLIRSKSIEIPFERQNQEWAV